MPVSRHLRRFVGPCLALLLLAPATWSASAITRAEEPETGLDGVVAVVNEACHSLALRVDGTVWGWGCNSDWDLGATAPDGEDSTSVPIQATGLDQVRALAFGYGHALAVRADGTVWAWGENDHGQVGVPPGEDCPFHSRPCSRVPVPVPGLSRVKAAAATDYSSFALTADGTVWSWGQGLLGELGTGTTEDSPAPRQVESLTDIVAISAAGYRVVALGADGAVWQWGGDFGGTPMPVPGLDDPVTVAAGDVRNLALMADGSVWAWGEEDAPAPGPVAGLGPMTAITGGGKLSAALAADGRVWAWGRTTSSGPPEEPTPVEDLGDVIAFSMGTDGDLVALKADGTVWTWRQYAKVHPVPAPATPTP